MENNDGWEEIGKVSAKWKYQRATSDSVVIQVKFIAGKAFFRTKDGQAIGFLDKPIFDNDMTFTAETSTIRLSIPTGIIKQFNS